MRLVGALLVAALVGSAPARGDEPAIRLLTRDGVLHALADGPAGGAALPVEQPTGLIALADGRLVVLDARGLLVVDGKKRTRVPGARGGLREVAPLGAQVAALTDSGDVVAIDPASGKRAPLGRVDQAGPVASDGERVLVGHGRQLSQVGGPSWTLAGRPIALAAADGRVFAATKEGPLWQLDRATGALRDLGGGAWFNVLAMQATATRLYVLTTSGKVWELDFTATPMKKRALAFDGWQLAIGLVVSAERPLR